MEFVYEVIPQKSYRLYDKEAVVRLKKMMATFEVMVNTTLPEIRVHLKEQ